MADITAARNYLACATFTHLSHHEFLTTQLFYNTITRDAASDAINISPGLPLDPAVLYREELNKELDWFQL
jgi:hypothetical protein